MTKADQTQSRKYRLVFKHTSAKKYAASLKAANADAKYWTSAGVQQVCIERRLPHSWSPVKCVRARGHRVTSSAMSRATPDMFGGRR